MKTVNLVFCIMVFGLMSGHITSHLWLAVQFRRVLLGTGDEAEEKTRRWQLSNSMVGIYHYITA